VPGQTNPDGLPKSLSYDVAQPPSAVPQTNFGIGSQSLSPHVPPVESFVVSDLGIAKALARRGRLRLRAFGGCMAPRLREGDVLRVVPRTASETAVGDVVVFRRDNRLFAHRVIDKGVADQEAYVETRPDQASQGSDGRSYDRDILGVVAGIEKGKKRFLPSWAPGAVAWVQGLPMYRRMARWWLDRRRGTLDYAVYAPLHPGQRCDVYRKIPLAEFAFLPLQPETGGLDRWSLLVWIGKGSRPGGWMDLAACAAAGAVHGWTVAGTRIRRRLQGTGIDVLLEAKAAELLAQRDMSLLRRVRR